MPKKIQTSSSGNAISWYHSLTGVHPEHQESNFVSKKTINLNLLSDPGLGRPWAT